MRRLKTLNRDQRARDVVARMAARSQDGSPMEFGLLCYEAGREAGIAQERQRRQQVDSAANVLRAALERPLVLGLERKREAAIAAAARGLVAAFACLKT